MDDKMESTRPKWLRWVLIGGITAVGVFLIYELLIKKATSGAASTGSLTATPVPGLVTAGNTTTPGDTTPSGPPSYHPPIWAMSPAHMAPIPTFAATAPASPQPIVNTSPYASVPGGVALQNVVFQAPSVAQSRVHQQVVFNRLQSAIASRGQATQNYQPNPFASLTHTPVGSFHYSAPTSYHVTAPSQAQQVTRQNVYANRLRSALRNRG